MCTVSAHEGKQTLYIDVLQSVLLLYLPHHLCNIRSPHSYLSPPGKSGRGIRQKRLVLWSVSLWFFGLIAHVRQEIIAQGVKQWYYIY